MSVSGVRVWVSCMMAVLCPLSLMAADTHSAILHSDGGVWVNGNEVAASTAIFPGDVLETKPGFVANLDAEGSSVLIQPESIVKFEGTYLDLEHGSVSVGTATEMSVHVNCIRVTPVTSDRTQYDVADLSGSVQVDARKNDVKITRGGLKKTTPDDASQSATVHEGHEDKRDESALCGAPLRPEAPTNGLNTKWIEIGGAAGGGALVLCILLCKSSSHSTTSVSPSTP